jgi:glycosyltransferase involved in cell wall biosynthesis
MRRRVKRDIYIDITDILHFMRYAKNVTGIQRATLLIIENLLITSPSLNIRFIAHHPVFHTMVEFDGGWLKHARGSAPKDFIKQFSLKANAAFFRKLIANAFGFSDRAIYPIKWYKPCPQAGDIICILGNYWGHAGLFRYLRNQASKGVKVKVLIYDLIPVLHPEFSPKSFNRLYGKKLLALSQFAHSYFAISKCTANDLHQYLLSSDKRTKASIVTIPLAQEFPEWTALAVVKTNIHRQIEAFSQGAFVLCVGTVEQRKNPLALLAVWQRLVKEHGAAIPKLVFAGKSGWHIDGFKSIMTKTNCLDGQVVHIEDANDVELNLMLQNCLFTTYPSFYEGWGLPIGEALWFGKTCVTSSRSSMPEAGGDMCLYADPNDIEAIYQAINSLIFRPELRVNMEVRIAKTKLRTWTDVASDLAQVLPL